MLNLCTTPTCSSPPWRRRTSGRRRTTSGRSSAPTASRVRPACMYFHCSHHFLSADVQRHGHERQGEATSICLLSTQLHGMWCLLVRAVSEYCHVLVCVAGDGRGPSYTFVYPNVMVNRYSMWMGTMRVSHLLSSDRLTSAGSQLEGHACAEVACKRSVQRKVLHALCASGHAGTLPFWQS